MAKERMEKRYRVISPAPMWHDLFQCHVWAGEDYNMDARFPDGRKWKTAEETLFYLDNSYMEIYYAPYGTPHVVHKLPSIDAYDEARGGIYPVERWGEAQKQWAGETTFIERYEPQPAVKSED